MRSLDSILMDKELRYVKQNDLLTKFKKPIVVLSLNMPSYISEDVKKVVRESFSLKEKTIYEEEYLNNTYYVIDDDAIKIKKRMIKCEKSQIFGRLIDLDVVDEMGTLVNRRNIGLPPRKCFVCENDAHICIREKKHSKDEITEFIINLLSSHVADLATKSLMEELDLHPKPGLVTPYSNGCHKDMDYSLMKKVIGNLHTYWIDLAKFGYNGNFAKARKLGIEMEDKMYEVTNGVNTHKGAIFILGTLVYAFMNSLSGKGNMQDIIVKLWADYNPYDDDKYSSHGKIAKRNDVMNIIDEAKTGFKKCFSNIHLKGHQLFYKLLSEVDDTNIIHRTNFETLKHIQKEANEIYLNPSKEQELTLELYVKSVNASPGGVADMYAATIFLNKLCKGH